MANVIDSISNTLVAEITPTIHESLWELDPVFSMIHNSSKGVERITNRGIGKSFKVLKTYRTGVAGGAKFVSATGGNVLSGPQNFNAYDTPRLFQAVDEQVAPAFIQASATLIEHRGNIYLPHHILRADQLNASIGSVVAQTMKGVGELLAIQEAATWYTTSPTTFALADIGDTSVTVSNASGDTSAVNVNLGGTGASGRIHRFKQGQLVDQYSSDGLTKRNSTFNIYVDNVDPLAQTLRLRRVDGGDLQTSTVLNGGVTYAGAGADDDLLIIKDSIGIAPTALETMIVDGSVLTSWFDIDVRNFGQFKSHVVSNSSAALTEMSLNRRAGYFYESLPGRKLDCAITTMGCILGFIDNLDKQAEGGLTAQSGRFRYDRNGNPLEVDAGFESFKYRFAGRPMEIYASTMCASGTFYAGKLKNGGLKRYVPPPIPGAKVDKRFGVEVEFVGTIGGTGGYNGIFKHAHGSNGATSDFIEAPFVRQWQIMPEQPNFMKISSIAEVGSFST